MNKPQKRNYLHKNNSGFTLVGVLMVLVVLSVLGLSILMITSNSVKIAAGERDDQSVFYIAEAGLTVEMDEIERKIQSAYNNTNDANSFFNELFSKIVISGKSSSTTFEKTLGGTTPEAKIDVEELNSGNPTREYKVTSTGFIDKDFINKKSRVVEKEFSVTWVPKSSGFGDIVIFVKETIKVENGSINGSLGTIKTGANSVVATGGSIKKGSSIYVPKGSEEIAVNKLHWMNDFPNATGIEMGEFPRLPPFPVQDFEKLSKLNLPLDYVYSAKAFIAGGKLSVINNPTNGHELDLSANMKFNEIYLDNDSTLYINIGNNNREILVNHLNLINGHIKIVGNGKLTFYVKDSITLGSGAKINKGGVSENINIYLKGSENPSVTKVVSIKGAQEIHGSLYAEDADIQITGGGAIKGNIFTGGKNFEVSGGAWSHSPLLFAPNARFNHLNGTINGRIIANTYKITGGANLNFSEIDVKDGPISPGAIPGLGGSGDVIIDRKALQEK